MLRGGVVGHFANSVVSSVHRFVFSSSVNSAYDGIGQDNLEKNPLVTSSLFSLRSPEYWGYPAEKKILTVLEYPFLYARNFLLEISLFALLGYLAYRKKVRLFEYPILSSVVAVGFLLPFLFSTSYGTLNLTKLTAFSLMVLHLVGFAILFRMGFRRVLLIPMLVLFIFAAIPGALIGTNMQWKWISGKGREQACSQNPLCYKGEFADLLRKFEREYPGLKKVAVDPKNAKKVVDITNSYVYGYGDKQAEYVVDTPEWRKSRLVGDGAMLASLAILAESGEYRILKVR